MPKPESFSDRVYAAVKRDILVGVLEPAERLQEGQLATRYAVSKTPVREALNRLVHEGLLDVFPRVGYVVTDCTVAEAQSIFEFRAILERAAVELAARYITDTELEELEAMANLEARPGQRSTYEEFFAQNRRFHLLIATASRNGELVNAIAGLFDRVDRLLHYRLDFGEEGSSLESMRSEHLDLLAALRARDADAALEALMDGLDRTRTDVLRALMADAGSESGASGSAPRRRRPSRRADRPTHAAT
jgi:DNA-binding GntR family transcriptional regulator